ncbi:YfhO family protein [Rubrobacter tropicus]|uniref:YfhO family protein n=1 Tax=Rubrobacter tropicus TaxID=2653851 RepID=A0A6G8QAT4_9ACTN|nr:YfhO family protein [Rubrobacter tropicus]QIN83586.1 YfhO family protein [Rubrobacter tropicus]
MSAVREEGLDRRVNLAAKLFRSRLLPGVERHKDLAVGILLVVLSLVAVRDLVAGGTVVGKDTITQYYTWYSYLGERLRSGDVPAWNPHQFSGAPFAGDPLSGWTYLPAMVLFTALPVSAAAKSYLFVHLLLAGVFTYALARALRMNLAGALLAAVAYEFNVFMYWRNLCCSPYASVMAWLPLAILGVELAIRSPRRTDRGFWLGVGGLALSQIMAAWPGQGSYYALLALGGYVAYRTLLSPPEYVRGLRGRTLTFLLYGGGVLLCGFGLAAAGLLPRVEYQTLSTLADGYGNIEGVRAAWGGWTSEDWQRLLTPGLVYPGIAVLALALAAPLVARGRHAVPFFLVLSLCALVLSAPDGTVLHSALYQLLPGFEWMHPHGPGRIKVILYLGLALLAGATLSRLGERNTGTLLAVPVVTSLLLAICAVALLATEGPPAGHGIGVSLVSLSALVVINGCLVVYARAPAGRRGAVLLMVLVLFADLLAAGRATVAERATADLGKDLVKVDLPRFFEPTGAAKFIRAETENEPARYFGYGPRRLGDGWSFNYNNWFAERDTSALLASNMATPMGLDGIQGYNAVHIARYDEYMKALNGRSQGYHNADVVPRGLDSPLLDLLNVRYVIVPADVDADQDELLELKGDHPTVYADGRVEVLENRDALPRAWIVHSARQAPRAETLERLGSGAVDPRQTALLERPPPDLERPADPSADRATVTKYEADQIELETSTGARGLLVLSEAYYPAWKAYVDGQPVPLYAADHVLRAVPVPAGEHTVELRYESWSLRTGMAISLGSCLALVGLVAARARHRPEKPTSACRPPESDAGIAR